MDKDSKIYVAGHTGLVGSNIVKILKEQGYTNIITRTRKELDLFEEGAVRTFFEKERIDYVFLAAALVGGIKANCTFPADFYLFNTMIQNNVISSASDFSVKKLLFLGSSCIYPKNCPQPIKEEYLLTGPLEETNKAYAVAKIGGIELCQAYNKQDGCNFISVMPTNLYGVEDNFDLETSHVLPALLRKIHEAKIKGKEEVEVWGTGEPRREFMHVRDLAEACVFLMNSYNSSEIINIGTGKDISINSLAHLISEIVGYKGRIVFNTDLPNGTMRKVLDVSKINALGWKAKIELSDGIKQIYEQVKHKF